MSSLRSSRDKATSVKTLLCLVQALEGRITKVELRNEVHIEGRIDDVDGRMNLQMSDVTVRLLDGGQRAFEHFYVRGRNIRYVHIPPDVNIMATLEETVRRAQRVADCGAAASAASTGSNELQVLITRRKREQFRRQHAAAKAKAADSVKTS